MITPKINLRADLIMVGAIVLILLVALAVLTYLDTTGSMVANWAQDFYRFVLRQ